MLHALVAPLHLKRRGIQQSMDALEVPVGIKPELWELPPLAEQWNGVHRTARL